MVGPVDWRVTDGGILLLTDKDGEMVWACDHAEGDHRHVVLVGLGGVYVQPAQGSRRASFMRCQDVLVPVDKQAVRRVVAEAEGGDPGLERTQEMSDERVRFVLTCGACPEQYDVFLGSERIGYVRLRHGALRVDYPDCGEQTVMEAELNDWNDQGAFATEEQRCEYLTAAEVVLLAAHDASHD